MSLSSSAELLLKLTDVRYKKDSLRINIPMDESSDRVEMDISPDYSPPPAVVPRKPINNDGVSYLLLAET